MSPLLLCALAEAGTVSGLIFDAAGQPVSGVTVSKDGTSGAVTDADGGFRLEVAEGSVALTLTAADRAGITLAAVSVVDGEITELLITLGDGTPQVVVEEPSTSTGVVSDEVVTGTLGGIITAEDGRPLGGARVFVRGQIVEARSEEDGRFSLTVPAGVHEISVLRSGYSTRSVTDIDVPGDGAADVAVAMVQAGVRVEAFVVLMPRTSGGTATLMAERQSTSDMVDTLSAEEMSRRGDSSAASALKRVTGLTVVGGKYVYVRGLGERYSSTLLNGSTLPSPEPERRVVPLDLFPTAMLSSVVVQKTFSPQMPAEFGGGVVRLRTRGVPDEPLLSASISTNYENGSTLQQGLTGPDSGGLDWLGYGAAHRALPAEILAAAEEEALAQGSTLPNSGGYTAEELEAFGEIMPNRWGLEAATTLPDLSASLVAGRGVDVGKDSRIGALAGLTFGNSWDYETYTTTYYGLDGADLKLVNEYDFQDTTNQVRIGGIGELSAELGEHHSIRTTSLIARDTESAARQYQGVNEDIGGEIRVQRLRWVERQLLVQQASGDHTLPPLANLNVAWRYAWSRAKRLEPDRRDLLLEPSSEGGWEMRTQGGGNNIFYSTLADTNHDAGLEVSLPFGAEEEDALGGRISVGSGAMRRERDVETRRFSYVLKTSGGDVDLSFLNNDPDQIFNADSIAPGVLQFEENTQPTDNYVANQDINSLFFLADGRLPWRMQYIGGARRESSVQQVETFQLFNPDLVPELADLSTTDWLPALTLTQRLDRPDADHRLQLRTGYGRTVSRPDFRELSPAVFNDVVGGREVTGNPFLKRAFIDSYDLRLEWYPSSDESLSIGGFYKRFTDPIETVIVVSAVSRVSYDNAESADNVGAELEFRKRVWQEGLLSDVYLTGNTTLIRSRVNLGDVGGAQTSSVRPLQGQSPYVINLQLSYEGLDSPFSTSLLYNVFGPRIAEVGKNGLPDTYEQPIHRVDAVAALAMGRGWRLSVSGRNLLGQGSQMTQGDETVKAVSDGWTVGLGLSWKAEARE
ncbi:MAG: hypothetical protein ACI8RZ_003405 [Myxococcota bacterium]|jgi:hypothetical protein